LSNAQGLSIISTFKSLQKNINFFLKEKVILPNSFRTLNDQYNANLYQEVIFNKPIKHNKLFSITKYEYFLNKDYFPSLQKRSKASSFDIIEVIGEALLNIGSKLFLTNPDVRVTTNGDRIFEDWGTDTQAT
jgi:hypothetical protein